MTSNLGKNIVGVRFISRGGGVESIVFLIADVKCQFRYSSNSKRMLIDMGVDKRGLNNKIAKIGFQFIVLGVAEIERYTSDAG